MGARYEEQLKRGSIAFSDTFRSVWVFVLLGVEGIKTFKANPYLTLVYQLNFLVYYLHSCSRISTYKFPTWATPLVVLLFVTALVPNTSFLGHLCSIATGYICESSLVT